MPPTHPLATLAVSPQGAQVLAPLPLPLHVPPSLAATPSAQVYPGALKDFLPSLWRENEGLIFALAVGAVVRLIAPLLQNKATDPAVVVVDLAGKWALCLSGGHQGQGDRLTEWVAEQLGAEAILSGAGQTLGYVPLDTLGEPWGWRRGAGDWTGISAALARGEVVQVIQEGGDPLWQKHLPPEQPLSFESDGQKPGGRLWITPRSAALEPGDRPQAYWHPRLLWAGVGCTRGAGADFLAESLEAVLAQFGLAQAALAGLASLDLKADEAGLLELAARLALPFQTFAPEVLKAIPVPNPSEAVNQEVGTPSVAEAAAIASAAPYGYRKLRVAKQIYKAGAEACTWAIALAEREFNPHPGALWLVGSGPGALDQLTVAARSALKQAQVWIGYGLYLDLLAPLRRPGQIVEAYPITQERQRCQRAIELAQRGLNVAVISSGDCGVYGMAGLVLEELQQQGWDGKTPAVEVFPGITALQAAAAKVGAPLMHDFCSISLSDLLTPREKILLRLEAAAQADFVTALYNPQSQTRVQLIRDCQTIFLRWRAPETPVVLARSVYRDGEQITCTTLAQLLTHPIDMLTVVLIGNGATRRYQDLLITPRGY